MPRSLLEKINNFLWGFLLLALPVTSFPLILRVIGGNSVAPLSIVPLALLTLTLLIPNLLRKKSVPVEVLPLLLFICVAIIATSLGYFKNIPSFRQVSIFRNALEGFLTLITGICFFLVPIYIVRNQNDLVTTLRLIYIAFAVILLFCFLQASTWLIFKTFPQWLYVIQYFFSSSEKIFIRRVYGLAFEPSWLANQLNILFIPLFLSASFQGFSLMRKKLFGRISLEHTLLFLSLVALFLSFSRIGWLTGLALLAFVLIRILNHVIDTTNKTGNPISFAKRIFIWMGLLLFLGGLIMVLGLILTKIDPRNAKLFDVQRFKEFGFLGWASQLGIAERVVFWIAAYHVYLIHPILGVGLGGAGYYFNEVLPNYGFRLPEIVKVITTESFIPNSKNLWVRLLSETGILGFICIVLWLYMIIKATLELEKKDKPEIHRLMGMFGKLSILALFLEGFSTDTFGLPYYWLAFGLVVAVSRIDNVAQPSVNLEK